MTLEKETIIVNIDPKDSKTSRPYYKFIYHKYEIGDRVVESFHRLAEFRVRGNCCWAYNSYESWKASAEKTKKQFAKFN